MKSLHIKSFKQWSYAAVAVLFLASCGGDDDNDNSAGNNNGAPNSVIPSANNTVASNTFSGTLAGAQEVPPNASTATGSGVLIIDPATRLMKATIITAGMVGVAAHIHLAPPGVAGLIIFPMTQSAADSGIWTTQATLTEAQLNDFRAGNYYFNVHSAAFPNGEIRAQILQQAPGTSGAGATGTTGITGTTGLIGTAITGTTGTTGLIGNSPTGAGTGAGAGRTSIRATGTTASSSS